jgi:hypothetical protein
MSKISRLIVFAVVSLASCQDISNDIKNKFNNSSNISSIDTVLYNKVTEIYFQDTMLDIGTVKEGKEYELVYHYENKGTAPLMLFSVSPSCGCTIAEFSRHPLAAGGKDSIIAKFDSKEKAGSYQKSVKVNCNSKEKVHTLFFRVDVRA